MSESLLKKEFKERDVNTARNLIKKDYTAKTQQGIGYQKAYEKHVEGDVWEEGGKQWTIKNGLKQNITKLDSIKKASRVPLTCPKCGTSMNYHLHKKMYKIHKMCFDCVIDMEGELRLAGLYDQYEKQMMYGNMEAFAKDIEAWVLESLSTDDSFVTEAGDIEDWKSNTAAQKEKITAKLQEYLKHLRSNMK